MKKHAFVGFDVTERDACIYIQEVREDGELPPREPAASAHVRYLDSDELEEIAEKLNQQEGWSE